jgi:hypothetical protein
VLPDRREKSSNIKHFDVLFLYARLGYPTCSVHGVLKFWYTTHRQPVGMQRAIAGMIVPAIEVMREVGLETVIVSGYPPPSTTTTITRTAVSVPHTVIFEPF